MHEHCFERPGLGVEAVASLVANGGGITSRDVAHYRPRRSDMRRLPRSPLPPFGLYIISLSGASPRLSRSPPPPPHSDPRHHPIFHMQIAKGHHSQSQDIDSKMDTQISDGEYSQITDTAAVNGPVKSLVHETMGNAWTINANHAMAFIFDAISPARQFKRGMLYDANANFPKYDSEDHTETDTVAPGWMPFRPKSYSCVPSAYILSDRH
jgi:hypothetical protein